MRGEVALTNRTIVIEGEADANDKKMGGHIKVSHYTVQLYDHNQIIVNFIKHNIYSLYAVS